MSDIVPPHDIESEQAVLGSILIDCEGCLDVVSSLGNSEVFYDPKHREIYAAIHGLVHSNEPVDILTTRKTLDDAGKLKQVGGAAYLSALTDVVPTAANVKHFAKRVRDTWLAREILGSAKRWTGECFLADRPAEDILEDIARTASELSGATSSRHPVPMAELVREEFRQIELRHERRQDIIGIPTGFRDLDEAISGLCAPDLLVVAGRPSMGKTSLAMNVAENVSLAGKSTLVFSLEMGKEQVTQRMLASRGKVNIHRLRSGQLRDHEWPKLANATGQMHHAALHVDDSSGLTILDVRSKARAIKRRHGLDLVVVDYLQLMRGMDTRAGREREIADISAGLKEMAKELGVPVIALSQLNRSLEQRQDKRPMMSDLRESGAIEQDADIVLMLYRHGYYTDDPTDDTAEVLIRKHRNGSVGKVILRWLPTYTRFESVEPRGNGSPREEPTYSHEQESML